VKTDRRDAEKLARSYRSGGPDARLGAGRLARGPAGSGSSARSGQGGQSTPASSSDGSGVVLSPAAFRRSRPAAKTAWPERGSEGNRLEGAAPSSPNLQPNARERQAAPEGRDGRRARARRIHLGQRKRSRTSPSRQDHSCQGRSLKRPPYKERRPPSKRNQEMKRNGQRPGGNGKENPRRFYATRLWPGFAFLVRGSSRRFMTMKAGSGPILEYQTDHPSIQLPGPLAPLRLEIQLRNPP
jgi:hypothetical protein